MIMPAISSGPNGGEHKPDCSVTVSATRNECAGCGTAILDRYYLSAVDRQWHIHCLKCSQCKIALDSELTCFSREGHIYCKEDYYRIFAMKRCSRCGQGIYASELVMKVRDNIYHMQCFTCAWCNTTLAQGDYFGLKDNLVYCRTHYEMLTCGHFLLSSENAIHPSAQERTTGTPIMPAYGSIYSANSGGGGTAPVGSTGGTATGGVRKGRPRKRKGTDGTPLHDTHSPGVASTPSSRSPTLGNTMDGNVVSNLSSSIDTGCLSDGQSSITSTSLVLSGHASGQRTKRMRTSFKHHQLRTMKSYFSINQNPDAKDLKQLAQKTGLSKRVLQV
ncbi:LIM/homeobox protein Lhx2-like [Oppia nitens]|uniref:LIM/homeobox protein Lhx2-like n=1 Tax=Oppia nitens TaxID=1686743 RepID=UPI0023DCB56F|nr:LIM/homeobox protein Lhx2-like [Oppia nitens]